MISLHLPHNDALVFCIQIVQAVIEQIHLNERSVANILQLFVIQQMGLENKITRLAELFTGFSGATSIIVGAIDLDIYSPLVVCNYNFLVINEVSPYNNILGRPWITDIGVVTSAMH